MYQELSKIHMKKQILPKDKESDKQGRLGGSVVEHLPLAQGMIPGSRDGVLHQVPHWEPASSSAYVSISFSVSLMNK